MTEQTTLEAVREFYRIAKLPPAEVNWEEIYARQERAQKRLAEKQACLSEVL
jgi:hypothetical protein